MSHYINGSGCPNCFGNAQLTTESFIEKAKKVHGEKYDYSKVEYKNSETKVCIICPEHGEFWQTPHSHLNGTGCHRCAIEKVNEKQKLTTESFIEKAKKVHGNKYDYSKVKYASSQTKVCIICPEHGEFWQTPNVHLSGSGCPSCNEYKLEKETKLFLTKHNIKFEFQKRFKWLGLQSLDFYLPDYNIGIECQGMQHFEPVDFTSKMTEEEKIYKFKLQVERDKRKKELCEQNGIKLVYINYNEKNVEKIIKFIVDNGKRNF